VTFCFTPQHLGVEPHHTSPARDPQAFADFCAWMIDRYAPAGARGVAGAVPFSLREDESVSLLASLHLNRDERLAAERSAT
jgi:hypothetical protein